MPSQEIPIVSLNTLIAENSQHYSTSILDNEIRGIDVEHVAITTKETITDSFEEACKTIYLFVKGEGEVIAESTNYEIVPETIFLPNALKNISIRSANNDALHYLKISCQLSVQDKLDLQRLPAENIQNAYYAKFSDCQPYTEAIKSPNTVSRTILSNEYIPRVAMGTVQTVGPDKVAAHEHPMLEQLFLGLSDNSCIVYADDEKVDFTQYSVIHIPLGSSHSVFVEKDKIMYYVWMDFFRNKEGEEWLKTHNIDSDT